MIHPAPVVEALVLSDKKESWGRQLQMTWLMSLVMLGVVGMREE